MKKNNLFLALLFGYLSASNAQTNNIILGRPTDTTITASVMFDQSAQFYLQYGTVSGNYTNTTPVNNAVANTPDEIDLKKGALFCEMKITDDGVFLVCKNFGYNSKSFRLSMDKNLIFQKLTDQELILLSALDHLAK